MQSPTLQQLPESSRSGWPWNAASPDLPAATPAGTPWPRISIVTPSFNQARFAEAAIRSVLLQGYPNLEYFIIDGGSTDGTLDVVGRYERWITAWMSEPDRGQSEAVNRGWSRATGEVIGWINTDDLLLPGALQRVAAEFTTEPQPVAIVGGGLLIDEHGRTIGRTRPRPLDLESALLSGNFHQPCVFLRRSAIHEVGLLDTRLHLIMDWHYWIRLLLRYEPQAIRYTNAPLAASRRWAGTKSSRGRMAASSEERRMVLNELFEGAMLPPHLLARHTQAIATTYWRQGHLQREAQHPLAALQSVRRAHQLAPHLYPWSVGWVVQFWLHTYFRYPFWLVPYWAGRRVRRRVSGEAQAVRRPAAGPRERAARRPLRVLVCCGSYAYSLLHPDKEKNLCRELQARGFEVRRLLLDTYEPHYPPVAAGDLPDVPARAVRTLEAALWWLPWADIVLVPYHRGSEQVVEWARRLGKVTVQHDDHGGTDSRYLGADWVAVKGPWFREHILRAHPDLGERVIDTGSIEFDDIHSPETRQWTRERFCREYGLDPAKRMAVWLPSAIFRQDDWSQAKYREVCGIVQASPSHSLIIKGHATDYVRFFGNEPDPFGGRHTWDELFPDAPVCRPEHTTICFANCDVGLTINSSVGLEFPLFGKPVVYVDAFNSPRVKLRAEMAPSSKYPIQDWASWPVPWAPAHIGLSITSSELPEVLAGLRYDVGTPEDYAATVARFYVANDGQTYRRLADVVSLAAEEARTRARRWPQPAGRWLGLMARVWPPVIKRRWLGAG